MADMDTLGEQAHFQTTRLASRLRSAGFRVTIRFAIFASASFIVSIFNSSIGVQSGRRISSVSLTQLFHTTQNF